MDTSQHSQARLAGINQPFMLVLALESGVLWILGIITALLSSLTDRSWTIPSLCIVNGLVVLMAGLLLRDSHVNTTHSKIDAGSLMIVAGATVILAEIIIRLASNDRFDGDALAMDFGPQPDGAPNRAFADNDTTVANVVQGALAFFLFPLEPLWRVEGVILVFDALSMWCVAFPLYHVFNHMLDHGKDFARSTFSNNTFEWAVGFLCGSSVAMFVMALLQYLDINNPLVDYTTIQRQRAVARCREALPDLERRDIETAEAEAEVTTKFRRTSELYDQVRYVMRMARVVMGFSLWMCAILIAIMYGVTFSEHDSDAKFSDSNDTNIQDKGALFITFIPVMILSLTVFCLCVAKYRHIHNEETERFRQQKSVVVVNDKQELRRLTELREQEARAQGRSEQDIRRSRDSFFRVMIPNIDVEPNIELDARMSMAPGGINDITEEDIEEIRASRASLALVGGSVDNRAEVVRRANEELRRGSFRPGGSQQGADDGVTVGFVGMSAQAAAAHRSPMSTSGGGRKLLKPSEAELQKRGQESVSRMVDSVDVDGTSNSVNRRRGDVSPGLHEGIDLHELSGDDDFDRESISSMASSASAMHRNTLLLEQRRRQAEARQEGEGEGGIAVRTEKESVVKKEKEKEKAKRKKKDSDGTKESTSAIRKKKLRRKDSTAQMFEGMSEKERYIAVFGTDVNAWSDDSLVADSNQEDSDDGVVSDSDSQLRQSKHRKRSLVFRDTEGADATSTSSDEEDDESDSDLQDESDEEGESDEGSSNESSSEEMEESDDAEEESDEEGSDEDEDEDEEEEEELWEVRREEMRRKRRRERAKLLRYTDN